MDNQPLLDIAAAIADGMPVDWDVAERSVGSDEDRRLLAALQFIAELGPVRVVTPFPPTASGAANALGDAHTALPAADPHADTWGPLTIIDKVGSGTFGDVFHAWDRTLDREVALKILRRADGHDETRASTVIEEGRLLARLRHPNIVTVYGAERVNGQVGLWMEFIHGKTLEQELREQGPFGVEQTIEVGAALAEALAAVHSAGLVHRDVKAQNVMRDRDGRLALTDFGAGCALEDAPDRPAQGLVGTPGCVAPEVLTGQAATPRSDIYSLGVLLYHLATGTYPVRGRSLKDIREGHEQGRRVQLTDARADLPADFVRIIDTALDPNPQRRYASAEEFGIALAAAKKEILGGERSSRISGANAWRRRALAIACGLLLAAGLSALAIWHHVEPPVIAVLPLKNLSIEPGSDEFVDGLTDEIIRNLSAIDGLEVRSRTSSFALKDKPRNLAEVAAELGANLVLEGSVLRDASRLRINAQLVRTDKDIPVWASRFDRELKDVFAVQDEISRSIVNGLRLKLGGRRRYETSVEAYDLYLRARALSVRQGSPPGILQSIGPLEQAIAKDPSFAPAYAGLATAYAYRSVQFPLDHPSNELLNMRTTAEKAIELDPLLAEAHDALAMAYAREAQWDEAEKSFRHAIDLDPNRSTTHLDYGFWLLLVLGRVDEALQQLRVAERSDPLSPPARQFTGYVLISAGQYDQAFEHCQKLPANERLRGECLGRARLWQGRIDEAIELLSHDPALPNNPQTRGFLGHAYARAGRRDEAEKMANGSTYANEQALIFAGLGDKNRTLEALNRMAALGPQRIGIYLASPELALLRGDSRLSAFRKRVGLPD